MSSMTFSQRRRLYRLSLALFFRLTDSMPYFILGAVLTFVLMTSSMVETFQSIDKAQLAVCTLEKLPIQQQPASYKLFFPIRQGESL